MTTNGDERNDDETDYDFLIEKTLFLNDNDDGNATANDYGVIRMIFQGKTRNIVCCCYG